MGESLGVARIRRGRILIVQRIRHRIRRGPALTIAQDAATCVVYGMPKAAAELKAAAEILPIAEIGPRIVEAVLSSIVSGKTLHARRG